MAEMRHGISDAVEGHLFVRGRFALRRTKKYICLDSQTLLCSADKKAPVKMEIPISGAVITNNEHNRLIRIMNEKKRVTLYADTPEDYARWLEVLQKAACSNIEDFYEFGERLGEGAFATVYQGIDKTTLETFAIKVIDKGKADNEIEFIQRETRIMKTIDHPNVIKTYDVFDTKSNLYLVMEYMPGGTLADIMKAKLLRTEKTVKSVMFDILQGVAYLHRMHIVHRDLKLKNILPFRCARDPEGPALRHCRGFVVMWSHSAPPPDGQVSVFRKDCAGHPQARLHRQGGAKRARVGLCIQGGPKLRPVTS
mmetsp:Transcript_4340/g.13126  ORF Transcript_4340/g.13126 Transcript_4340/m.13126 type:complete len:310 (+) Transcript_4340:232-1161(+)